MAGMRQGLSTQGRVKGQNADLLARHTKKRRWSTNQARLGPPSRVVELVNDVLGRGTWRSTSNTSTARRSA
jgi:hypothetical protein